jgi:hypothetical protein
MWDEGTKKASIHTALYCCLEVKFSPSTDDVPTVKVRHAVQAIYTGTETAVLRRAQHGDRLVHMSRSQGLDRWMQP